MGARKEIRDALEEFLKHPDDGTIGSTLERYLSRIAATGITLYPWTKLKPLIVRKMNLVIEEFQKEYPVEVQTSCPNVEGVCFDAMKKRLHDSIELFNGIPFTIQRICELLTDQNISMQYRRIDKFMRGIEKNLIVVTTVDPFGNRIVGDPKSASNGVLSLEEDCLALPQTCTPVSKTPSSWFSSLSSVVDSPDSYPNWKHSPEDQRPQDGVTSSSPDKKRLDDDCLPPPNKLFRSSDDKLSAKDEGDSPNAAGFTPLLTQLLNGSPTLASPEKNSNLLERCDSTESQDAQRSGLLEILTNKLKSPESESRDAEATLASEARPSCGSKEREDGDAAEDVEMRDDERADDVTNDQSRSSAHGFHGDDIMSVEYRVEIESGRKDSKVGATEGSRRPASRDPIETATPLGKSPPTETDC